MLNEGSSPPRATPWYLSKGLWVAVALSASGLLTNPDILAALPPAWASWLLIVGGPLVAFIRLVTSSAIAGTPAAANANAETQATVDAAVKAATPWWRTGTAPDGFTAFPKE